MFLLLCSFGPGFFSGLCASFVAPPLVSPAPLSRPSFSAVLCLLSRVVGASGLLGFWGSSLALEVVATLSMPYCFLSRVTPAGLCVFFFRQETVAFGKFLGVVRSSAYLRCLCLGSLPRRSAHGTLESLFEWDVMVRCSGCSSGNALEGTVTYPAVSVSSFEFVHVRSRSSKSKG